MKLYAQFILCLITGLFGLCWMLKTLFDTLLAEWDPSADLRAFLSPSRLKRSFMMDWEQERAIRAAGPRWNFPQ